MIDKFKTADFGSMRPSRLHGHVKVTLKDTRTGETKKVEGDNIVTNAIYNIFARNICGGVDYSKLLPIATRWFGGVLCYGNAHTLNPDNFYPQSDTDNPLVAHAGDVAPSTSAIVQEDLKRGSPSNFIVGDGFIKAVWEFLPSQGNGTINGISLTHKDTGNVGLGNTSTAFKAFNPFDLINISNYTTNAGLLSTDQAYTQYDDNHALVFYIGELGEYGSGSGIPSFRFHTTKVSLYIRHLAMNKAGLIDTNSATDTDERAFDVETSIDFYMQPAYYFDPDTKYLWLFTNITSTDFAYSSQYMKYTVIDCEAGEEVTSGTYESDALNFAPVSYDSTGITYSLKSQINISKMGDFFLFPTCQGAFNFGGDLGVINGYQMIDTTLPTNQKTVSFNEVQKRIRSSMVGGGLLLTSGRVVNGNTGYTCNDFLPWEQRNPSFAFASPSEVSSYLSAICGGEPSTGGTCPRWIVANKMVNTTLYNPSEPIVKTASQSMVIEYTLREEEES